MSDSYRERIADAAVARVDAAGKPAGLNVHRFRERSITRDKLPAAVVYFVEEKAVPLVGGDVTGRELRLRVELRVEEDIAPAPAVPTPIDSLLDPLITWAVQAIMADKYFGKLATDTLEAGTKWSLLEAEKMYGGAAVDFLIGYDTLATDPTDR